jgi:hypothetical protein
LFALALPPPLFPPLTPLKPPRPKKAFAVCVYIVAVVVVFPAGLNTFGEAGLCSLVMVCAGSVSRSSFQPTPYGPAMFFIRNGTCCDTKTNVTLVLSRCGLLWFGGLHTRIVAVSMVYHPRLECDIASVYSAPGVYPVWYARRRCRTV